MGRILAIDYGHKRVGLAISDSSRSLATPHTSLRRDQQFFPRLAELLIAEEIESIVVGLPITLQGEEGRDAVNIRNFGKQLTNKFSLPVFFHDERFSTVEAHEIMEATGTKRHKRQEKVDSIAAAVMLQSYLDGLK
jgi:putative Holliday junction resolvase